MDNIKVVLFAFGFIVGIFLGFYIGDKQSRDVNYILTLQVDEMTRKFSDIAGFEKASSIRDEAYYIAVKSFDYIGR
jgi:hypothetical protein